MLTIHKYELAITDRQTIDLPCNSEILCVDTQNGKVCVWVVVETTYQMEPYQFRIVGTGRPMVAYDIYYGTVQLNGFVWHVFGDCPKYNPQ